MPVLQHPMIFLIVQVVPGPSFGSSIHLADSLVCDNKLLCDHNPAGMDNVNVVTFDTVAFTLDL